jgi:hypothetical protein
MRFLSGPLLMACLLLTSGGPEKCAKSNQADTSQCGVITRALSDYSRIRVGAQRKDVERYFERDGGFQSPSGTRFTHIPHAAIFIWTWNIRGFIWETSLFS